MPIPQDDAPIGILTSSRIVTGSVGVSVYEQVSAMDLHGLPDSGAVHVHDLGRLVRVGLLALLPHLPAHALPLSEWLL